MPVDLSCSAVDEVLDGSDLYFLRHMGKSFTAPTLALDQKNRMWVIKPQLNSWTHNGLANEFLGSHLCRALGIPTPECRKILIEDAYFDDPKTWSRTEQAEPERPPAGLHLACRYVPDAENTEVLEYLPPQLRGQFISRQECLEMAIFDAWASHSDARQALFYERAGRMRATFFDHSHLFGGPFWSRRGKCYAPANYVQRVAASEYSEHVVEDFIFRMQQIVPAVIEKVISSIPGSWYHGDIAGLRDFYLKRLRATHLLLVEVLLLVQERAPGIIECERSVDQDDDEDHLLRLLSQRGTEMWL